MSAAASFSRVRAIIRREIGEAATRPLFWIWAALLAAVAWLFSSGSLTIGAGDSQVGGQRAWVTSEFAMAQVFAIGTLLFHGFFAAVVCGVPVLRDEEARVHELLHTTPMTRKEYVGANFGAALALSVAMLALQAVFAIALNHLLPTDKPELHGPFALTHYVRPLVFLALPLVVFVAGLAFALGTWSGRVVTVFALPVGLLMACAFLLWTWAPLGLSPRTNAALMLVDPTGFRWLQQTYLEVDRGVAFYNHATVDYGVPFLASRAFWAAFGIAIVARVAREPKQRPATKASRPPASPPPSLVSPHPAATQRTAVAWSPPSPLAATWALARTELLGLVRHPGLYLFVPVILLTVLPDAFEGSGPFDSDLLPVPGVLAQKSMPALLTCAVLILLFYVVESLERDLRTRLAPMVLTAPVAHAPLVLGRLLASLALGVLVLVVAWLACLLLMVLHGAPSKSAWPFVILWGACGLPTLFAWSALVAATWCRTKNRYVTYGAGLLVLILTGVVFLKGKDSWLTNWALWKSVLYSDISRLELDRPILILNRLFLLALALFFARAAVFWFPRAEADEAGSPRPRLRSMPALRRVWPFALPPVFLGLALWGYEQTGFQSGAAETAAKQYWKKNVATYKDAPVPDIAFADVDVAIEPSEGAMRVRGAYTLVNRNAEPLRHVLLTLGHHLKGPQFTVNGAPATLEDRSGLYIYTPPSPIPHDGELTLGFSYAGRLPDGPSKRGGRLAEFILPSGAVLTSLQPTFVPVLGFQSGIGVDEDNSAEERVYEPDFYVGRTRPALPSAGAPFRTRIRVTVPQDFTANSVGTKTRELVENGKRTSQWESLEPVYFFNVVCGRYAMYTSDDVEIYYDPRHGMNVPELALALASAKRLYSEWFFPFPWKTLKLTEYPGLDVSAQGFPTNITFSENIGFYADPRSTDHLPFWIAAHEAAHQWWPNLVIPGDGPGAEVLSEGLSHFSAMLLLRAVKGEEARMDFATRIEHNYEKTRSHDAEQPLVSVDSGGERRGIKTVWYDRGGWAFWMLLHAMGQNEMFSGLHEFIATYRGNPDHPTFFDLFEVLRRHARDPASFDDCVSQWFDQVTLPRFELSSVEKSRTAEGFRVRGEVKNAGTGTVSVELAASREARFSAGAPSSTYRDARARVRLGPGASAPFSIDAPFEPDRLTVDPDVMVLQLGRKGATVRL